MAAEHQEIRQKDSRTRDYGQIDVVLDLRPVPGTVAPAEPRQHREDLLPDWANVPQSTHVHRLGVMVATAGIRTDLPFRLHLSGGRVSYFDDRAAAFVEILLHSLEYDPIDHLERVASGSWHHGFSRMNAKVFPQLSRLSSNILPRRICPALMVLLLLSRGCHHEPARLATSGRLASASETTSAPGTTARRSMPAECPVARQRLAAWRLRASPRAGHH